MSDSYKPDYGGQIHEVPEHPEYGLTFVVCRNGESLGLHEDNTGCMTVDEAVSHVVGEAGGVILDAGYDYDEDGCFEHWNGGRRLQYSDYTTGDVAAYVWLREQDAAGEWGNWKRRVREECPEALAEAERVADLADEALSQAVEDVTIDDDDEDDDNDNDD